ncbi:MAG: hypothetical protein MZU84_09130 [Sphingobacterium sp.]|nr:hypothetical protein [Sphingobacterium sp.]
MKKLAFRLDRRPRRGPRHPPRSVRPGALQAAAEGGRRHRQRPADAHGLDEPGRRHDGPHRARIHALDRLSRRAPAADRRDAHHARPITAARS